MRRTLVAAVVLTISGLALSACSGESAPDPGASEGGIASEIKLVAVRNATGPVAYTGLSAAKGTELAIEEIESSGFLGEGVTIDITEYDSAFDPQTAASQLTSAIAGGGVSAILGPQVSNEALAVAPIAQNAGIPIVYTQSGVGGLLESGNLQFRASAPQESIWAAAVDNMKASGIETVSILTNGIPTYNELATAVLPELLDEAGIEILGTFEFENSATDFQAAASTIAASEPHAVLEIMTGSQVPTAVVQARQAGFTGQFYSANSMTDAQLASIGDAGVGLRFVTGFTYAIPEGVPAEFTTAFEEKFGELPDTYAAEAYDQTWWIARAVKHSNSSEPSAVAEGLVAVADEGFEGAQGPLTFENSNDARGVGTVVEWDGTEQIIAE
ncbi:ABC transporter substrate-binding protein [Microbacterium sp. zg.B48]|uniref:ABC transporter substrate-binding protein n=1 Tax=Microbacterium sp. zg.B48 TaxID=2969408 RepID=UPI00214C88CC|nr:ABC transporter substrate-binding protein [Microbacterium sp. zg.B48]MCR2764355.1 ABC transporter substrate-binding protein [Microbacterium sp. zg.B48]